MRRRWAMLAALLLAIAGTPSHAAEAPASTRIAVIDLQAVLRESAAMGTIQRQVGELRRANQEEFIAIEDEFRATEAQLAEDQAVLPEAEFRDKLHAFQQRVAEMQQSAQSRRAAVDQALDQAIATLRSTLLEVVATIAREQQFDLVLDKAQVVVVERSLDISQETLARLDQRLPSIQVQMPQGEPGP